MDPCTSTASSSWLRFDGASLALHVRITCPPLTCAHRHAVLTAEQASSFAATRLILSCVASAASSSPLTLADPLPSRSCRGAMPRQKLAGSPQAGKLWCKQDGSGAWSSRMSAGSSWHSSCTREAWTASSLWQLQVEMTPKRSSSARRPTKSLLLIFCLKQTRTLPYQPPSC
eukprot:312442-Hanusia_phi.AAC.1